MRISDWSSDVCSSDLNTLTTAVRATEVGAYDSLPKPFDLDALMRAVAGALAREGGVPVAPLGEEDAALPLIGRSPAMQDVYRGSARVVSTAIGRASCGAGGGPHVDGSVVAVVLQTKQ